MLLSSDTQISQKIRLFDNATWIHKCEFFDIVHLNLNFVKICKCDYSKTFVLQVHLAPGMKFDFQKYIKRSLEDDFKVVVGIRLTHILDALVIAFFCFNSVFIFFFFFL